MKNTALIVLAVTLSGCTASYKKVPLMSQLGKLEKGRSVVITTPQDGQYEDEKYPESGAATALSVRAAFAVFTNSISVSDCKDLRCLQSRQERADYFVIPEVLHWEERATEWSGIPDQIEIKLSVFEGGAGKEIAATMFTGKSSWATFGGDHPQDLLEEPVKEFVKSLY